MKNLMATREFTCKTAETRVLWQQLLPILIYPLFKISENHTTIPFGLEQSQPIFKVDLHSQSGSSPSHHLFARQKTLHCPCVFGG